MADANARRAARGATLSLGFAMALAAFAAIGAPACLDQREQVATDPDVARCTSCHGDPERAGDFLLRSAPPYDLSRQTSPGNAGVGAHAVHLNASATHPAVACDECHTVPEDVDSPGHADDARPADISFGGLAAHGDREPSYDAARRTCVDSYCHGSGRPVWTEPLAEAERCGTCHGLPPPAPHPQSDRCYACHGDVIDSERRFLEPSRHVDGTVDYAAGDCRLCHGSEDNAAPPADTHGNTALTALGVGAHQAHLAGGENSRPLECGECHRVPERIEEPTHVDASPAEVTFTGVATAMGREPRWDASQATCSASFCHAPSADAVHASPVWNEPGSLDCDSCHASPPAPPHPQMSDCSVCHAEVFDSDRNVVDRLLHVDGVVQVDVEERCTGCHGDENAAPPRDIAGNLATTAPGVGAHQTHVLGTEHSRAVPCAECHSVPAETLEAGHADSARPAELVFSGVALAHGATPVYENGTCRSTSCHGDVFPDEHESGGTHTVPTWTRVDGSETQCGSCHGIPPPPPHPNPGYPCRHCHGNVGADDVSFVRPDLHVDGIVTMALED
jgi:predicted CxxxxCH...CXXCH cytochrome family protein